MLRLSEVLAATLTARQFMEDIDGRRNYLCGSRKAGRKGGGRGRCSQAGR
jgi:hypothetical protein